MVKSAIGILSVILLFSNNSGTFACFPEVVKLPVTVQDTIFNRQLLYNGRIWKARHGEVLNSEFFLTKSWLPGDVTINKKTFSNVMLRYDLLNDELLLMVNPGTAIILSNEKVGSFTLRDETGEYRFTNYTFADSSLLKGYGQILYNGKTSLVIKYIKQIKLLAVENKYDEFYQNQQVFIVKNGKFNRVRSKRDLLSLLADHKVEIQKYLKEKGLMVSFSKPETLIPVLQYFDSVNHGI